MISRGNAWDRLWISPFLGSDWSAYWRIFARYDNGHEKLSSTTIRTLTSKATFLWAQRSQVEIRFIQPGKPSQDAFVSMASSERPASTHWFTDLGDARRTIEVGAFTTTAFDHTALWHIEREQFRKETEEGYGKDGSFRTLERPFKFPTFPQPRRRR
jgi:hypothetical protein